MSDILSQNEIDLLLNELNSGELDLEEIKDTGKKEIKKYDFKRPNKFAKDHIRTLNVIHDNYGKTISTLLTRLLRTTSEVELITIEVLTYRDFSNSISNPSILSIIEMKPLNGSIVLEIPPSISYGIIDRILGGYTDNEESSKEFTDIEISIMEGILKEMLQAMKEPWENIIHLDPVLERIETNPQMAQITSQTDIVILISYKVKIGNIENFINICIPDIVIDPIISKLSTKLWFSKQDKKTYEEKEGNISKAIEDTNVRLKAILGKTQVSFDDITNMQIGDVISLDKHMKDKLEINVDENLKYLGNPGINNNKYSVKITDIIDVEKENEN